MNNDKDKRRNVQPIKQRRERKRAGEGGRERERKESGETERDRTYREGEREEKKRQIDR